MTTHEKAELNVTKEEICKRIKRINKTQAYMAEIQKKYDKLDALTNYPGKCRVIARRTRFFVKRADPQKEMEVDVMDLFAILDRWEREIAELKEDIDKEMEGMA